MDDPLVSVIIPVYNGERYLRAALDSVFAQNYHPMEVIVVDHGSVDGTAAIACSDPTVRYIYQTNRGHGSAKNVGVALATGEFLAFLDADDLWAPNKLRVQIEYLLKHPDVAYALCRMCLFLEPGTDPPAWLTKELLVEAPNAYVPSALVVRQPALAQIGLFDSSYKHGNDSDWFFRAKDIGVSMTIVPDTLLYRRIHHSNLSHDGQGMTAELLQIVRASVKRKQVSKERT